MPKTYSHYKYTKKHQFGIKYLGKVNYKFLVLLFHNPNFWELEHYTLFFSNMFKSLGNSTCADSACCCLRCRSQVAAEDQVVDAQWRIGCDGCLEANKTCTCNNNIGNDGTAKDLKDVHKANSSFLHAVVNMIGMLIGILLCMV